MVLLGEQGCAKSTTTRIVKLLIDPMGVPLKRQPRTDQDVMISAQNTRLMAFDKISRLPGWLSDCLCQMATGGGLSTRKLYTDEEEVTFDVIRAVVLNGITEFVERGDLASRSVFFSLPAIPEEKRRTESDLKAAIELALPGAFGALLDLFVAATKILPDIALEGMPRMADFARFGEAVGQATGKPPGAFIAAYTANRKDATSVILDVDPVAVQIRALMNGQDHWVGTCATLLNALGKIGGDDLRRQQDWPATARGLMSLWFALTRFSSPAKYNSQSSATRRLPTVTGMEPSTMDLCQAHALLSESMDLGLVALAVHGRCPAFRSIPIPRFR